MTLQEFRLSLSTAESPAVSLPLKALWWDAKGDWTKAHDLLQDDTTSAGSWVHAYLHRKEPDPANATYWYRRAGKPVGNGSFEAEWESIATTLLNSET